MAGPSVSICMSARIAAERDIVTKRLDFARYPEIVIGQNSAEHMADGSQPTTGFKAICNGVRSRPSFEPFSQATIDLEYGISPN